MAISAGLPKPAVYVIDDPSPNVLWNGVSPDRAAITATTGLLQIMNRDELEGVISHEMSHIRNYDVRLILIVSTLIGFAALVASLLWRSAFFMRPRAEDSGQAVLLIYANRNAPDPGGLPGRPADPALAVTLPRRARGRQWRQSHPQSAGLDARAAEARGERPSPSRSFNHATAAMCIDDPLQHHEAWYHHLFDTHPPLEERIVILEKIATGQPT